MEIQYGLGISLLSTLFFVLVKFVVKYTRHPKCVKKDVKKWNSYVVSSVHAYICAAGSICSFVFYPDDFKDLSVEGSPLVYLTVCMSVGYFTFDFFDMLLTAEESSLTDIISHHVGVMALLYHNITLRICIPYIVLGLICEINTVFLHLRKILQMARLTHLSFYRAVLAINIVTFVMFRFVPLVWSAYAVLFHFYGKIPLLSHAYITASTLVIYITNCRLFWRILKNDYLKDKKRVKDIPPEGTEKIMQSLKCNKIS